DRIMLGVAGFDIGLVQRVEPGPVALLVARPRFSKPPVLLLRQGAEESQLVRGRAVVGEYQQECRIAVFDGLMEAEGCTLAPHLVLLRFSELQPGGLQYHHRPREPVIEIPFRRLISIPRSEWLGLGQWLLIELVEHDALAPDV